MQHLIHLRLLYPILKGEFHVNPLAILQLKNSWEQFQRNHPKFPRFLQAVTQNALTEGTIMEITVTTAEGKTYSSNLKLNESDMELIRQIRELSQNPPR